MEANIDAPNGNVVPPGCSTFKASPTTNSAQQGGALLCSGRANCVGFTTFRYGGQSWACPKATITPRLVTQPPARAACLYRKIAA